MELPGFRAGSAIERRCQQPWREVRLAAQHFVNFVPAGKRRLTSGTTDADGGGRAGERQCIERRTLLDHPGGEGAGKGVAGDAVIAGIDDKTPYVQRAITQVYEDWLIQAGGSHFNAALTRPTNDTPEGFAALSQHVRHGLVTRVMPAEGVDSGVPNLHAFCAGRVATQQLWPGDLANCEAWTPDVFADILVGEPFRGPAKQGLQLFVDKYMAYKLTRSPDAVFATLEWLSRVEVNYAINVQWRRSMPCRAAAESLGLYQISPWREFMENWKFGVQRPVVADHFDVQPAMGRWVEKAALGEVSVREALQGMDAEVERIMAG